jgi:hypothetical protein
MLEDAVGRAGEDIGSDGFCNGANAIHGARLAVRDALAGLLQNMEEEGHELGIVLRRVQSGRYCWSMPLTPAVIEAARG